MLMTTTRRRTNSCHRNQRGNRHAQRTAPLRRGQSSPQLDDEHVDDDALDAVLGERNRMDFALDFRLVLIIFLFFVSVIIALVSVYLPSSA